MLWLHSQVLGLLEIFSSVCVQRQDIMYTLLFQTRAQLCHRWVCQWEAFAHEAMPRSVVARTMFLLAKAPIDH